jgi:hypothetical protein
MDDVLKVALQRMPQAIAVPDETAAVASTEAKDEARLTAH